LNAFCEEQARFEMEFSAKVEYTVEEDQLHLFISLAGEAAMKSRCKWASSRPFWSLGHEVETNLMHNKCEGQVRLGQLAPDLAVYLSGGNGGDGAGVGIGSPNHGNIVVEIDWLSDARIALDKNDRYFHPAFVGPNGTFVSEVWNILLPEYVLLPPVGGYNPPLLVDNWHTVQPAAPVEEPFLEGIPFQLPVTGPVFPGGLPAMPVVIMSHRNNAYPSVIYHLQWNTRLRPPVGSALAATLDVRVNNLLRETNRI
jgi:hypothetical protein